jgi:hypothetical protein
VSAPLRSCPRTCEKPLPLLLFTGVLLWRRFTWATACRMYCVLFHPVHAMLWPVITGPSVLEVSGSCRHHMHMHGSCARSTAGTSYRISAGALQQPDHHCSLRESSSTPCDPFSCFLCPPTCCYMLATAAMVTWIYWLLVWLLIVSQFFFLQFSLSPILILINQNLCSSKSTYIPLVKAMCSHI